MRAAFALLANTEVYNRVRKLSWEFHEKYHTGLRHCSLPPHVSLKQPFAIGDLTELEQYMDLLARSIDPFDIHLTKLDVMPVTYQEMEYGILWVDVQETVVLRELHNRIHDELTQRFGQVPADYDGEAYHFHMTVMIGGQPIGIYRKFYAEIPDPVWNLSFTTRELALFVYDEPLEPNSDYLCYKILPLGKSS